MEIYESYPETGTIDSRDVPIQYVSVEPGTEATTQRDGVEVQRGPFAVPQPGEACPLCREKTPNKHALEMRAWRKKRKEKR